MIQSEILARCVREMRHSKNMSMLSVAKRYSELFLKQIDTGCVDMYRGLIDSIYKAQKKRLE